MSRSLFLALLVFCIFSAGLVCADPITFSGSEGGLSFTGIANYSSGKLTITLKNTSSVIENMSGFAFNSSISDVTVSLDSAASAGFASGALTSVVYPNYGSYQYGASGGSLAPNDTANLSFTVAGAGESSVVSALTFFRQGGTAAGNGYANEPFVAQFGAQYVGDVAVDVPLPATAWAGLALLAAFGFAQRFHSHRLRTA